LGVEEEYLLLDRVTGLPAPVAEAVRAGAALQPALGSGDVQRELLQVQVEVATPVCHELDEAGGHLLRLRHGLSTSAEEQGAVLLACGAAPWHDGGTPVTDEPRYRRIHDRAPGLVEEQLINGMHVHVAVPTREHGLEVVNRLRADLPLLLALAANSPFWQGRDTGFASWRTVHFERWPVAGPPPHVDGEEDYDRRVTALLGTGALLDAGQLYWQARVSERYPTVEVRCADVQLRADDAVLLAGLVRALVATALEDAGDGVPYAIAPGELLRAACWGAARHGLDGDLYDVRRGRRRPPTDMLADLLDRVQAALRAAGDADQVRALADRLLREGTGATRQREAARRGAGALVDFVAAETVAAGPGAVP
jgi:carboxylate-amine ligase